MAKLVLAVHGQRKRFKSCSLKVQLIFIFFFGRDIDALVLFYQKIMKNQFIIFKIFF
jgi:hypothetical protein